MPVLRFPLGAQENVLPESFEAYSYRVDKSIENTQKLAQLDISLPIEVSKQFDTSNTTVYDKKAPSAHVFLDGKGHDTYVVDVQAPEGTVIAMEDANMTLITLLTNAVELIEKANKNGVLMRSNIYEYVLVGGHLKVFGAFLSTTIGKVSKFADHLFLWKSCSLFLDDIKRAEADTFFLQLFRSKPVFKDMQDANLFAIRDASLHARELHQWSITSAYKLSAKRLPIPIKMSTEQIVGIASGVVTGLAGLGGLGYFIHSKLNPLSEIDARIKVLEGQIKKAKKEMEKAREESQRLGKAFQASEIPNERDDLRKEHGTATSLFSELRDKVLTYERELNELQVKKKEEEIAEKTRLFEERKKKEEEAKKK